MKSLIILICSLWGVFLITPAQIQSQPLYLRSGIYFFTDLTASEFYYMAPSFLAGYDVWKKSRLSLLVSSGISYTSVRYNDHRHHLFMVPVLLTVYYDIHNPGSAVFPVAGMGAGLWGKADKNSALGKTNYFLTYGFHATGGLRFNIKNHIMLALDLSYNLLIPPVTEDINLNGVMVTAGIRLPLIKQKEEIKE